MPSHRAEELAGPGALTDNDPRTIRVQEKGGAHERRERRFRPGGGRCRQRREGHERDRGRALGRPHPTADSAIERGPATPEDRFAELARLTSAYMDAPEEAMLRRAFEFARDAHAGQCRVRRAFIIHPIEVGIILADLRMDAETITAALLTTPWRTRR
ncbi:MAG: hypothetical protein ACLSDQ_08800 [Adlercreutzia equolifaciens]